MKIAIASTGRSLDENVYKRFGNSPAYLIYDISDKSVRAINNFAKCQDGCGPQAAQMLVDNEIDTAIIGDIDEKSLEILKTGNIDIYYGYPGMGKEALQKLDEGKLAKINEASKAKKQQAEPVIKNDTSIAAMKERNIKKFTFLDLEQTYNGEFIPIEGWCMLLHQPVSGEIPSNWIAPYDFADGIYHLRLEVIDMKKTQKPIEFEFGWCNLPEEKHPNIPHRCNFGIYSSFTTPGVYEHIARIKDMENTSVDGTEEPWDWEAGWASPFTLIKIYKQKPYPVKVRCTVNIYSG
jgi:predicted Fe-Mo cluster-binding NifX family protein